MEDREIHLSRKPFTPACLNVVVEAVIAAWPNALGPRRDCPWIAQGVWLKSSLVSWPCAPTFAWRGLIGVIAKPVSKKNAVTMKWLVLDWVRRKAVMDVRKIPKSIVMGRAGPPDGSTSLWATANAMLPCPVNPKDLTEETVEWEGAMTPILAATAVFLTAWAVAV